jgi:hypothetical protein
MKFFVPHTADEAVALATFEAIRTFVAATTGLTVSHRKVFCLRYHHEQTEQYAKVGEPDPSSGEEIIAILHAHTFLICTRNHGVLRGRPIQIDEQAVDAVTDFA